MSSPVLTGFLLMSLVAVPIPRTDRDDDKRDTGQLGRGQTVLLGTWTWNIEKDKLGKSEPPDLWWEQVRAGEQYLVPQGGTALAILKGQAFENVGRDDLAKANFANQNLANVFLTPGTVIAVRTSKGNLAKLRVLRYRDSHDLDFKESKYLDPQMVAMFLRRPNIKDYHLEVQWVLYNK